MLLRNGCGGQVGIESGLSIAVAFYSWAWAQHGVVAATARDWPGLEQSLNPC